MSLDDFLLINLLLYHSEVKPKLDLMENYITLIKSNHLHSSHLLLQVIAKSNVEQSIVNFKITLLFTYPSR